MYKKALLFRFTNNIETVAFLTYPSLADSIALPQTFLIAVFWTYVSHKLWEKNVLLWWKWNSYRPRKITLPCWKGAILKTISSVYPVVKFLTNILSVLIHDMVPVFSFRKSIRPEISSERILSTVAFRRKLSWAVSLVYISTLAISLSKVLRRSHLTKPWSFI